MAILWETTDRLNRTVVLTDEAWAHILSRHADLAGYVDVLREVIHRAEVIRADARFVHREVHYLRIESELPPLRVVVNYRPVAPSVWRGEVVTAHFKRREPKGERLLWP